MTSSAVQVRAMRPADLPMVVGEHQKSLPDGLYARLGNRFLRAYYSTYLASSGAAALVGELDARPVGFVAGIVSVPAHQQAMKRAWPRLAATAILALLHQPATLGPALIGGTAASYLRRSARLLQPQPPAPDSVLPTGILTYVAVTSSARGNGVGSALVKAFLDRARLHGCTKVTLVTAVGPDDATPFYANRGWVSQAVQHTATGRPLRVMAWTDLPEVVARKQP